MKKKAKQKKVTNVMYRKESKTFDDWMKYEIEITSSDGYVEIIPAYGKDLQDALSRVVHDGKVKAIEKEVINKVPVTGWAIAWFLGLSVLILTGYVVTDHKNTGWWILGTIVTYAFMTLSINNWFTLRNNARNS